MKISSRGRSVENCFHFVSSVQYCSFVLPRMDSSEQYCTVGEDRSELRWEAYFHQNIPNNNMFIQNLSLQYEAKILNVTLKYSQMRFLYLLKKTLLGFKEDDVTEVELTKVHLVSHIYMIQGFVSDGLYKMIKILYFYWFHYHIIYAIDFFCNKSIKGFCKIKFQET